ncbi:hypothetical protein GX48_06716 [Paracoccidioides brasiliensis]|nr:hypothetical protein GX48_06716 [Paracoccidioides brasiliensis]
MAVVPQPSVPLMSRVVADHNTKLEAHVNPPESFKCNGIDTDNEGKVERPRRQRKSPLIFMVTGAAEPAVVGTGLAGMDLFFGQKTFSSVLSVPDHALAFSRYWSSFFDQFLKFRTSPPEDSTRLTFP